MIIAKDYNVELRDKTGNLKKYLTPFVKNLTWEWNRLGGCGNCSFVLSKAYREVNFDVMDDIQIRVPQVDYADLHTKVLIHFDGADGASAYTAETGQVLTFAGTAQLDTAQKKLGSASLLLDGNSDYVTLPVDLPLGINKFSVEARVRVAAFAGSDTHQVIFSKYTDSNNYWFFSLYEGAAGSLSTPHFYGVINGVSFNYNIGVPLFSLNTWYHIAWVRSGNNLYFFINGVRYIVSTNCTLDVPTLTSALNIGRDAANGSRFFNGNIDEVRISTNIDRWTADFTPRANAYSHDFNATKLVYRGFVSGIGGTMKVGQDIKVSVKGYSELLRKKVIHNLGDVKEYTSSEISVIVGDIIDTFVVTSSDITKGTVEAGSFVCDTIKFMGSVWDALQTLAELAGDVEWGVNEDLSFFWRIESNVIRHKFIIGDKTVSLERKVDYFKLKNKIYLVGGDNAGVKYRRTGENTDSQDKYFLAEEIVNNGSITSDTVADQYTGAILTENAQPTETFTAQIKNIFKRFEDVLPLGLITFYDVKYDRSNYSARVGDIIGEAADGGSDLVIGEAADGGSDATIGGQYSSQIDRIVYSLSNTRGRFNVSLELGDTILEMAARVKKLEQAMQSAQQN